MVRFKDLVSSSKPSHNSPEKSIRENLLIMHSKKPHNMLNLLAKDMSHCSSSWQLLKVCVKVALEEDFCIETSTYFVGMSHQVNKSS